MMIIFYITKQYLLLQVRRGGDLRIVWRKQIMSTTVKNEPTTPPPPPHPPNFGGVRGGGGGGVLGGGFEKRGFLVKIF